jgi:hypothetical protein
LTTQIAGALLVVAMLVFAGVFFPLVTEHLFSQALLLTAAVIGLVWVVFDVNRWIGEFRRHRREVQAAMFSPATMATTAGEIPQSEIAMTEAAEADDSPPASESHDGEGGDQ